MRTLIVLLATAVSLVACTGSEREAVPAEGNTATSEADGSDGSTTSDPDGLHVIVAPDDGSLPTGIEVGCISGPWFPASALDEVPPVEESGLSGLTEAMATFLGNDEGSHWPQEDWRVLHASDAQVLLVHLDSADADGVSFMTLEGSDGAWQWAGATSPASCQLRTELREGLNTVGWALDPDHPAPTPESTSVHLLVTEQECVSGQAMGDRLLGPEVVLTESDVLIAFAAEIPPGEAQNCPGNPSSSVVVELGEPLGDRDLRDGLAVGDELADYLR